MSIHRYRSTWRSITFNTHLDDSGIVDEPTRLVTAVMEANSYYALDSASHNRVSVQDYRELRQFLEGAEPNEAYEGVRAIEGMGRIVGANIGDLEDKAWALNEAFSVAACRVAAATADPKGVLPFSFKRAITGAEGASRALRFWCRPGPGRPLWISRRQEGLVRPFTFQLIAFDPFAYEEAQTQTNQAIPGPSVITNAGNIYTKPQIRLTWVGAGNAAFTITNQTTGKVLVINATTAAGGETWVIDVATSRMYRLSDGANRYSARVSGYVSDMILAPGGNSILLANTANINTVSWLWRGAYA